MNADEALAISADPNGHTHNEVVIARLTLAAEVREQAHRIDWARKLCTDAAESDSELAAFAGQLLATLGGPR
jgi:hypothetical protein